MIHLKLKTSLISQWIYQKNIHSIYCLRWNQSSCFMVEEQRIMEYKKEAWEKFLFTDLNLSYRNVFPNGVEMCLPSLTGFKSHPSGWVMLILKIQSYCFITFQMFWTIYGSLELLCIKVVKTHCWITWFSSNLCGRMVM